jgi:hypothetical protein
MTAPAVPIVVSNRIAGLKRRTGVIGSNRDEAASSEADPAQTSQVSPSMVTLSHT